MNRLLSPPRAILITTALTGLPGQIQAQSSLDLATLVLSAAGVATDPLTAPASVTVVTAEELETQGVTDLTEALDAVPGVAASGAADGENIFMRGMPSEYTLILIDGKRINTRQSRTNASGGVDQYFLPPVSAIDRIEVVRGPMSSLYGSDAMGGVINIITKKSTPEWGGSLTLETTVPQNSEDSSQNQLSFALNGPLAGDTLGLQIWGRALKREGSTKVEDGSTVGASDRALSDIHARLSWQLAPDHALSLELGQTEIDTDPRLNTRSSAALGYEGNLAGWDVDAAYSVEQAKRETDGSARRPAIRTSVLDIKGSNQFDLAGRHELSLGGQHLNEELSDFNPGLGDARHYDFANSQWAVFAEDIWQVSSNFSLTLGTRYTEDEGFGGKLTPRAYALLEARDGLFLSAGVSQGYKTPDLRQSVEGYYLTTNRGGAVIAGTPDLNPEESTSYELGVRFENARSSFAVTGFHTDFQDKIDSRDTGGTTTINGTSYDLFEYYNIGRAQVRGVEVSAAHAVTEALRVSGSFTHTDSEVLSGALTGVPLARTPKRQASLRLDWQSPLDGLELWAAAQFIGDSVNVRSSSRGATIQEYDGYDMLDIGASYALSSTLTLRGALYNVTDVETTSAVNGTTRNGRTLWMAVTAEF